MFIIPAAITLVLGLTGRMENKRAFNKLTGPKFYGDYKLELWLSSLGVIFILWYVVLSLIPSLYVGQAKMHYDHMKKHSKPAFVIQACCSSQASDAGQSFVHGTREIYLMV